MNKEIGCLQWIETPQTMNLHEFFLLPNQFVTQRDFQKPFKGNIASHAFEVQMAISLLGETEVGKLLIWTSLAHQATCKSYLKGMHSF